ncbi:CRISPR type I-F/YPEST-associated protein Csy1 [Raoultella planticola]|uniref:CRISPR type I-F/YPEST-associated protein Csy1 n=1 Tax=Raoultella planticola TaxID=575 RepID=A0A485CZS9_RAOPL|nr:CRISPR type I-F/YPEST-associated protein Csy1 [Raoultella planticola]
MNTDRFAAFTDDAAQLDEWISGFSSALNTGEPTSHKLAKQSYFPVKEGYHLLSPLFATSLVSRSTPENGCVTLW